jgi:hypothetical protein
MGRGVDRRSAADDDDPSLRVRVALVQFGQFAPHQPPGRGGLVELREMRREKVEQRSLTLTEVTHG